MKEAKFGKGSLVLKRGDITKERVDAIVNAANSSLLGGGGVDGAIHRAGGPAIDEECKKVLALCGPCPTGKAVITKGGKLPSRYVIHAVGPRWSGGRQNERALLKSVYSSSLELAESNGLKTLAFPSISTGIFGFPIQEAAPIALSTVQNFLLTSATVREVRFILFSDEDLAIYEAALDEVVAGS